MKVLEAKRIKNDLPAPTIEVLPAEMAAQINAALAAVPETVDAETLRAADIASAHLHALEKAIESRRKALKKPITDLGKAIDSVAKGAAEPVAVARRSLNQRIGSHLAEIERQRQDAIRRAEEERRKAEEEARRKQEQAEAERRRQEAELAEQTGGLFDDLEIDEPADSQAETAVIERPPAPIIPPPAKSGAVQMRVVKVLRITDPAAIPRSYMHIDEAKVRKALLDGIDVPGAELVKEQQAAQRGGRR